MTQINDNTCNDEAFEKRWHQMLRFVRSKTMDEISNLKEIDPHVRKMLLTIKYGQEKRILEEILSELH